jgi:hypothetical protein
VAWDGEGDRDDDGEVVGEGEIGRLRWDRAESICGRCRGTEEGVDVGVTVRGKECSKTRECSDSGAKCQ